MLKKKRRDIIVVDNHTKEVLAIITGDTIVSRKDIEVIINDTPNKKMLIGISGNVYLKEEV